MIVKERLTDELVEELAEEFRKLRNLTFEQYVNQQIRIREEERRKIARMMDGWEMK